MSLPILKETQGMRLLSCLISKGNRIFDINDAKHVAQIENVPFEQLNKILSHCVKQRRLLRLRRGLYAIIGLLPEQSSPSAFVISSYLIQPSAISHWSALQHHGLTEQIPPFVTASTPKIVTTPSMREKKRALSKIKHAWEIAGVRYEYIQIEKKYFFGIEKIWMDEHFQVLITDKERTLLDVFVFPHVFGGMGEALGILENALSGSDIQKLVNYAIQYNRKSVIKRLGWALEYFDVPSKYVMPLLKISTRYFSRLNPLALATGPYDKRWMIQNNLIREKK